MSFSEARRSNYPQQVFMRLFLVLRSLSLLSSALPRFKGLKEVSRSTEPDMQKEEEFKWILKMVLFLCLSSSYENSFSLNTKGELCFGVDLDAFAFLGVSPRFSFSWNSLSRFSPLCTH